MDVLWLCVLLGLGAMFSPSIGPICVRVVHFLTRMLKNGPPFLRRQPEPSVPNACDTPYRDSKDARIHSLERRNEELENELAETKREVEQRGELIEQLWYRVHEAKRATEQPWAQGLLAAGCVIAATSAIAGGLCLIPPRMAESRWRPRIEPPTMVPIMMRTSGGEALVPQRLYVIVILTLPYDDGLNRCFDEPLVLEPTFTIVDLASERKRIRVVWFLTACEPDPPTPYLQL